MAFKKKQTKQFFEQFNGNFWFREKYHPLERIRWLEEIKERKQKGMLMWKSEMDSGIWDTVCLDEDSTTSKDPDSKESRALTLKSVSPSIAREKIHEVL